MQHTRTTSDKFLERICELLKGGKADPAGYRIHLYSNELDLDVSVQSVAPFTECYFLGYSPQRVDLSAWSGPRNVYGVTVLTAPTAHRWVSDPANYAWRVAGWFVTDERGELAFAESLYSVLDLRPGGVVDVLPEWRLSMFP